MGSFNSLKVLLLVILHSQVNAKSINYSQDDIQSEISSEDNLRTSGEMGEFFDRDNIEVVREDINNVGLYAENLAIDLVTQLSKYFQQQVSNLRDKELSYLGANKTPVSARINITEINKVENHDDLKTPLIDNLLSKLNSKNLSSNSIEKDFVFPEHDVDYFEKKNSSSSLHRIKERSLDVVSDENIPENSSRNQGTELRGTNTRTTHHLLADLVGSFEAKSLKDASQEFLNFFATHRKTNHFNDDSFLGDPHEAASGQITDISGQNNQKDSLQNQDDADISLEEFDDILDENSSGSSIRNRNTENESETANTRNAQGVLDDFVRSFEAKSLEDVSKVLFNMFDTNTQANEYEGGPLGNPGKNVSAEIPETETNSKLVNNLCEKSAETSLEEIARYVLDKVESSVENFLGEKAPEEMGDWDKKSDFFSELVKNFPNNSTNTAHVRNSRFQKSIEDFKSVTESTLQEIQDAIEKIIPQNISECIDGLVKQNTMNFQQFSLQLVKALQNQMKNETQSSEQTENLQTETTSNAEVNASVDDFENSSNETINELYRNFYDYLMEFSKISSGTSIKNATRIFLREARVKFGNIFNLGSTEDTYEDNPMFSVISTTIKELQEQFASRNAIPKSRNLQTKNQRHKRQVRPTEENSRKLPKTNATNRPEPRENFRPENSTRRPTTVDNASKRQMPFARVSKPTETNHNASNITTEKLISTTTQSAAEKDEPDEKTELEQNISPTKQRNADLEDIVNSNPGRNSIDGYGDLESQTRKCLQYEGEETLGSEHVTALKKEVEKLQNLVSILKQEERILEDIDKKSKHLNNSANADMNREELLKILQHLSRNRNKTSIDGISPTFSPAEQRIGEDLRLTDSNNIKSENSIIGREMEMIKLELRQAELSLNQTISALEKEVIRDNEMEMELNDQKLEINLLKSMLKVLMEKSFHGNSNKDPFEFHRTPVLPQRNQNNLNGNSIVVPSHFRPVVSPSSHRADPVFNGNNFVGQMQPVGEETAVQNNNLRNSDSRPITNNNIVGKSYNTNNLFPVKNLNPGTLQIVPMMNRNNVARASKQDGRPVQIINSRFGEDSPQVLQAERDPEPKFQARDNDNEENNIRARANELSQLRQLFEGINKNDQSPSNSAQVERRLKQLERQIKKNEEAEEMKRELEDLQRKIRKMENLTDEKNLSPANTAQVQQIRELLEKMQRPQSKTDDDVLNDELKDLKVAIDKLRPKDLDIDLTLDNDNDDVNSVFNKMINQDPDRQILVNRPPNNRRPLRPQAPIRDIRYGPLRAPVRRPIPAPVRIVDSLDYETPRGNSYHYNGISPFSKLICTLDSAPTVAVDSADSYETVPQTYSQIIPSKHQAAYSIPIANVLSYDAAPQQYAHNTVLKNQDFGSSSYGTIPSQYGGSFSKNQGYDDIADTVSYDLGPADYTPEISFKSPNRVKYDVTPPVYSHSVQYKNQVPTPSTKFIYEAPRGIKHPVYKQPIPQRVIHKNTGSYYQPSHSHNAQIPHPLPYYGGNNYKPDSIYPPPIQKHQTYDGTQYSSSPGPSTSAHTYQNQAQYDSGSAPAANTINSYQSQAVYQPAAAQSAPQEAVNKNTQGNTYGSNFFPVQASTRPEETYQPSYGPPAKTGPENLPSYPSYNQENPSVPQYGDAEVKRLKDEIYSLQNTINTLNSVDYIKKPEDAAIINKLQHEIYDVKNMMQAINQNGNKYNSQHSNSYSQPQPQSSGYGLNAAPNPGAYRSPPYTSRKSRHRRAAIWDDAEGFSRFIEGMDNLESNNNSDEPMKDDMIGSNLQEMRARVEELRQQLSPRLEQSTETNPGSRSALGAPYYPDLFQYGHPPASYPMDVKSAKSVEKTDWFTDIVAKLMDKIIAALPVVFKKLFNFLVGQFTFDLGYSGDGYYGDQYPSEIQTIFKHLGIFGVIPAIILRLVQGLSAFINILKKNKFLKNFLVPAAIVGLVAGAVIFLIWWLQPDEDYNYGYDQISGDAYGSPSYGKSYDTSVSTASNGDSSGQYYQKPTSDYGNNNNYNTYKKLSVIPTTSGSYR